MTSSCPSIPAACSRSTREPEVARDRRADVSVDHGGRRSLVLADLGQDLGRARHVDVVADGLADDRLDAALVLVVGVRVEERDRDRLDVLVPDLPRRVAHALLVELHPLLPARAEPLANLVSTPARDERWRNLVLDVVEHGDPQAAHLEHVAKALGRHERRSCAVPLEDRVRRDRRRVHDVCDLVWVDTVLREEGDGAVDHSAGVVVGRRQHLRGAHGAVVGEQHDVGEGATDVDAEPETLRGVLLHHSYRFSCGLSI